MDFTKRMLYPVNLIALVRNLDQRNDEITGKIGKYFIALMFNYFGVFPEGIDRCKICKHPSQLYLGADILYRVFLQIRCKFSKCDPVNEVSTESKHET